MLVQLNSRDGIEGKKELDTVMLKHTKCSQFSHRFVLETDES